MHSTKDFINRHARLMLLMLAFNSFLLSAMAFLGALGKGGAFGGIYFDLLIHSVVAYIIVRNADVRSETIGPTAIFHLCNTAMIITLMMVCVHKGFGYIIPEEVPLLGGKPGVLAAFGVAVPAIAAKLACEKKVRAFMATQNAKDPTKQTTTIDL